MVGLPPPPLPSGPRLVARLVYFALFVIFVVVAYQRGITLFRSFIKTSPEVGGQAAMFVMPFYIAVAACIAIALLNAVAVGQFASVPRIPRGVPRTIGLVISDVVLWNVMVMVLEALTSGVPTHRPPAATRRP